MMWGTKGGYDMTDTAFKFGKRDGASDANKASWLEWLSQTLADSPTDAAGEMYAAGYLVGMAERLAELTEDRKATHGMVGY